MADTIRILVATDNHVGYNERDPVRGDDSWKSFHEIMCLAKDQDVDMVLLGGDLFHDNVPSRKSMYNVMRSLRLNCYGDKPCELQLLSDGTEHFDTSIGHANYEDTNINVAIPVFSIHGNHDDPSGEGHYAALDILEMSGLVNYFGRVPRGDEINVRPVLLQKGSTKLALYGLSNVRDERMYHTFKDGKVAFFEPSVQKADWFNIAVVHQNHHARTATSYLPENFLPNFLDLVIWGHEHECDIEPHLNPEMDFRVMQPGSSVATSLVPGEAIPKQVTILSITGREFKSEPIRLKTVRPFVYKDIVLNQEKEAIKIAQKDNHRHRLSTWLQNLVDELITAAQQQWQEAQEEDDPESSQPECPLPLVRLRIETSPANGGTKFELENPQRFSNRFKGRIANSHDVVQFHIKKRAAAASRAAASEELKELMARPEVAENVKVSQLVQEFLAAQSLTILPQNYFGDAVNQYIDKDDKHAMDMFVNEALSKQVRHLVTMHEAEEEEEEEEDLAAQIDGFRSQMEEMFRKGQLKNRSGGKARYKPKPDGWDTDMDGEWEDQAAALITVEKDSDDDMFDDDVGTPEPQTSTRGRGRGRVRGVRGARGATTTSARGRGGAAAAPKKSTASTTKATTANGRAKGRKKAVEEDSDEDEEEDVVMLDNDDEDEDENSQAMFFSDKKKAGANASARGSRAGSVVSNSRATNGRAATSAGLTRKTPARAAASRTTKQSTINFSTSQASVFGNGRSQNGISDIEDDDDEDAFEPASTSRSMRRR
ncbi:meiotic recombination [Neophaeococcomyces mojaviensis]|uniref:Meiotic recombination n=1 Tax=Neophaeococcomyces mojaviensis TaxID=3383035 RepID=A0ACC3A2P6_9EURO|nr:meiotic recombination [Knufia sp. JES_112]